LRCSASEMCARAPGLDRSPVQHNSFSQAASPDQNVQQSSLTSCMHMHTRRRLAVQMRVRRRSVMMRQRTLRICGKMVWRPHSHTYATYQHLLSLLNYAPQVTIEVFVARKQPLADESNVWARIAVNFAADIFCLLAPTQHVHQIFLQQFWQCASAKEQRMPVDSTCMRCRTACKQGERGRMQARRCCCPRLRWCLRPSGATSPSWPRSRWRPHPRRRASCSAPWGGMAWPPASR